MKQLLALILLTLSMSAFAVDRNFTIEQRYVWTIKDKPCILLSNPDKLDLKEASVQDLKTGDSATGCALDDGTKIEFQIYLDETRSIQLTYATSLFKPIDGI